MDNKKDSYQIVATQPDGTSLTADVAPDKPLSIGSAPGSRLRLAGTSILPTHARLSMNIDYDLELTNLGKSSSVYLNGMPVTTLQATLCRPGSTIKLGSYTLLVEGEPDTNEPKKSTATAQQIDQFQPSALADSQRTLWPSPEVPAPIAQSKRETGPASSLGGQPSEPPSKTGTTFPEKVTTGPVEALSRSAQTSSLPQSKQTAAQERVVPSRQVMEVAIQADPVEESHTRPYRGPISVGEAPSKREQNLDNTASSAWYEAGGLAAQLSIDPVNVAPGERIRIPISVQNKTNHPLQIAATIIGLPEALATFIAPHLKLAAGETRAYDLILQTRPGDFVQSLDVAVRMSDVLSQQLAINLPLRLVFKKTPRIGIWLDPKVVRDPGPTYLYVQNHTQATTTVYISGHSGSALHVIPSRQEIELSPGQTVSVPVDLDASKRKLIRSQRQEFSISAWVGSRAPLDAPATVVVKPRLNIARILVFVLLLGFTLTALSFAIFGILQLIKRS